MRGKTKSQTSAIQPPDQAAKNQAEGEKAARALAKEIIAKFQIVTPEEVAEFEKRSQRWMQDHDSFHDWSLNRMYLYMQLLDKIATNPPPGRSAGMLMITAIKDVREQVATLVDLLVEQRTKSTGKRRT